MDLEDETYGSQETPPLSHSLAQIGALDLGRPRLSVSRNDKDLISHARPTIKTAKLSDKRQLYHEDKNTSIWYSSSKRSDTIQDDQIPLDASY